MGLRLNSSMVNNLVNNVYKLNGKDPYASDRHDAINTSKGVRNTFGDTYVTSRALKRTLNDPYGSIALSLSDKYHPDLSMQLASDLADGLDRADGRHDGMIRLKDTGTWSDLYGDSKAMVDQEEMAQALSSGQLVVGEGGQLLTRDQALNDGDTIIAIHEDSRGPKFTLDQ